MNNREELPEFLNSLGLTGKGVEVGVESGLFSDTILKKSNLHILFSVDSWCEYSDYPSGEISKPQERHDESMLAAIKILKPYGKRSQVFRLKSVGAAKLFQDHELDFVYIDAAHSYAECTNDILAWHPKVKPSGILAGHDYMDGDFGVKSAVNDFVANHDVDLQIIVDGAPSWYFKV
jgi:hypothetical protein